MFYDSENSKIRKSMTLDDDGLPDKGEMIQYFRIRVDEYREIKGRHQNGDFMTSNECKLIQSWSKDCERFLAVLTILGVNDEELDGIDYE